jgi:outer membrane receptor protein involved in Fe transport
MTLDRLLPRVSVVLRLFLSVSILLPSAGWADGGGMEEILFGDIPEVYLASRTKQTAAEAPAIVSVITDKDIRDMGARNWEDILRTVPGFDTVLKSLGLERPVNVRGVSSGGYMNKIKFMLNGHDVLNEETGGPGFIFPRLPVENISRVEVIRGPGSALYGSNAFLGVVNVVTKGSGDDSRVTAEGTSRSDSRATAFVSRKAGKGGFSLYADYARELGQRRRIEKDSADANFTGIKTAFGYPGPVGPTPAYTRQRAQSVILEPKLTAGDFYANAFFLGMRSEMPFGIASSITDENRTDVDNLMAEAGYKREFSPGNSLQVRGFYDWSALDGRWELFSEETAQLVDFANAIMSGGGAASHPAGEGIYMHLASKQTFYGAEGTLTVTPVDGVQLLGGLLYDAKLTHDAKEDTNSQIFEAFSPVVVNGVSRLPFEYLGGNQSVEPALLYVDGDILRVNTAAYGQATFDLKEIFSAPGLGKALTLTAGLRNDRYNDVGSSLNPRTGLVYAPTESLYFKALYGTAFRAPNIDEVRFRFNPFLNGSRNVKPEKLITAEFLAGWRPSGRVESTVTFARTRIRDLIEPGLSGLLAENKGKIEAQSVEWEARVSLTGRMRGYANATYQDVKNVTRATVTGALVGPMTPVSFTQPEFNPGGIPRYLGNVGLNADVSGKVNVNVFANHVGERSRSGELQFQAAGAPPNPPTTGVVEKKDAREPMKARTIVNLTTRLHDFDFAPGAELRLQVQNVFNAGWRDPDDRGVITNDLPRQGRDVSVQLSYIF